MEIQLLPRAKKAFIVKLAYSLLGAANSISQLWKDPPQLPPEALPPQLVGIF